MSRHRFVKQLNLADELDDDAFSEEDDYGAFKPAAQGITCIAIDAVLIGPSGCFALDMDDEQRAQMESSLESLQAMLGPDTSISEAQMKDALWNFYFDIEQSVTFLLGALRLWCQVACILTAVQTSSTRRNSKS